MKILAALFLFLAGCAPPVVSPGMTFLLTLDRYRGETAALEGQPSRWFDRQALAEWLKNRYAMSFGGSPEFARMVDLDFRRREFLITLRDPSLKPERAREIKEELPQINKQIQALKEPVKLQMANAELRLLREESQRVETVAAIGLLNLALDLFAAPNAAPRTPPVSSTVGQYAVADHGGFVTVKTPEGRNFRCTPVLFEEGAAIKCDPPGGK